MHRIGGGLQSAKHGLGIQQTQKRNALVTHPGIALVVRGCRNFQKQLSGELRQRQAVAAGMKIFYRGLYRLPTHQWMSVGQMRAAFRWSA